MKKLAAALVLGALLAPAAFADGMAFFKDPSLVEWVLLGENAQSALIHFYKGREALVISVAPEMGLTRLAAVWLFPIPARPEDVRIDILSGEARFEGNDILARFQDRLRAAVTASVVYSVLPLSVCAVPFAYFEKPDDGRHWLALGEDGETGRPPDVEVHAEITRFGLTTELVTARTPGALVKHLAAKGAALPAESTAFLDWYIGREYSFVVSFKAEPGSGAAPGRAMDPMTSFPRNLLKEGANPTGRRPTIGHGRIGHDGQYTVVEEPMTDREYAVWVAQFRNETAKPVPSSLWEAVPSGFLAGLSVLVSFPTDRIFFPMKPTAVYGQRRVPVELFVTGHVKPGVAGRLRSGTTVSYLEGALSFGAPEGPFWLGRRSSEIRDFTKIRLDAPADAFREDLWLDPLKPAGIRLIRFLSATAWLWTIVLYAGFSALASWAAGTVAYKVDRLPGLQLAVHGLWNGLTFIGFTIATSLRMKSAKLPEHLEAEIRKTGLSIRVRDDRKITYVLLFYFIFLALMISVPLIGALLLLGPYS